MRCRGGCARPASRGVGPMLDFTSALYLGMDHSHASLPPWQRLTEGRPAALAEAAGASRLARRVAALVGCQAAVLAPSTLHLQWDLGSLAAGRALFLDAGAYATGRWGAERASSLGARAAVFTHHDPEALARAVAGAAQPIVSCDGFCPGCGRFAPLGAYLDVIEKHNGWLLVDDTQAVGVWGRESEQSPYGNGGGGSLQRLGLAHPRIVLLMSLAKAFGAPIAALAGGTSFVDAFRAASATRQACSPPSAAALSALSAALDDNETRGERRRGILHSNVATLRDAFGRRGLRLRQSRFPVQTLGRGYDGAALHARLRQRGVSAVLHASRPGNEARLSFLVTSRHGVKELERVAEATWRSFASLSASGARRQTDQRRGERTCGRRAMAEG